MHADALPITGPCPIDLDAIGFDRDGRVSHCSHCSKNVHILSNMTKDEARRFLRDNRGKKLCISYARDAEGKIRFRQPAPAPEPALVPLSRLRPRRSKGAGLVAALGVGVALAACTPHTEDEPRDAVVEVQTSDAAEPEARTHEPGPGLARRILPIIEAPPEPVPTTKPTDGGLIERILPTIDTPPEPMPLAGAAMIPEEIMMEGEIEVPDPGVVDEEEPCDPKAEGSAPSEHEGTVAARTLEGL